MEAKGIIIGHRWIYVVKGGNGMKNYWRLLIKYFRSSDEILYKLFHITSALVLVLYIFGLLFLSGLRESSQSLLEVLFNEGWVGLTAGLVLILSFRNVPKTISKFIKAKGFNKAFWNDL